MQKGEQTKIKNEYKTVSALVVQSHLSVHAAALDFLQPLYLE